MKKITLILIFLFTLSCDDGNFDIPEFEFASISTINNCDDVDVVLYKINGSETLIIEIDPKLGADDGTFLTHIWDDTTPFTVSETGANKIIYRILDDTPTKDYYCQNIPPTTPAVVDEWQGTGVIIARTDFTQDDNDTVDEAKDDTIDRDEDGIPDYIDSDDDDDGIPTKDEDVDGDGDPTNDDTDGDGKPNYLDEDDDEDGLPTALESITEDDNGNDSKDYLDAETNNNALTEARTVKNSYEEVYETSMDIQSLKLTNNNGNTINFDLYNFGTKTNKVTIIEE